MTAFDFIPSHPEVKKLNAVIVQWVGQDQAPIVTIQTDNQANKEFLKARAQELMAFYNGAQR